MATLEPIIEPSATAPSRWAIWFGRFEAWLERVADRLKRTRHDLDCSIEQSAFFERRFFATHPRADTPQGEKATDHQDVCHRQGTHGQDVESIGVQSRPEVVKQEPYRREVEGGDGDHDDEPGNSEAGCFHGHVPVVAVG